MYGEKVSNTAETGFLGLMFLVALLLFFVLQDIRTIRNGFHPQKMLVLCFWSLFLYTLAEPTYVLTYWVLFWLVRALIVNSKEIKRAEEIL